MYIVFLSECYKLLSLGELFHLFPIARGGVETQM